MLAEKGVIFEVISYVVREPFVVLLLGDGNRLSRDGHRCKPSLSSSLFIRSQRRCCKLGVHCEGTKKGIHVSGGRSANDKAQQK